MEYEQVREQIARTIRDNVMSLAVSSHPHTSEKVADQILSLDGIEIRSDDQSLPEMPNFWNPRQVKAAKDFAFTMTMPNIKTIKFIRVIPKPKRK